MEHNFCSADTNHVLYTYLTFILCCHANSSQNQTVEPQSYPLQVLSSGNRARTPFQIIGRTECMAGDIWEPGLSTGLSCCSLVLTYLSVYTPLTYISKMFLFAVYFYSNAWTLPTCFAVNSSSATVLQLWLWETHWLCSSQETKAKDQMWCFTNLQV